MAKRRRISEDWAYDQVFGAILEQRLTPGTKLTEKELCEIFGVSRSVVRKVLLRLSLQRVVDLRPNKGAVIAAPETDDVRETFEARRLVEHGIVAAACGKCGTADEAALRKIVAREQDCAASGDKSGAIRLSGAFHLQLAAIAGNRPLHDMLRQLVALTSLAIALYEAPGRTLCIEDDHLRLIDAVRAGDAARSQAIMQDHLVRCERALNLESNGRANDLRIVFADVLKGRRSA